MSESEPPVLHISGIITEKDYKAALRARGIRYFVKYLLIYLLAMVCLLFGMDLYYWFPYLKDGTAAFGEWLDAAWASIIHLSSITYFILAGFLIIYALWLIVIIPIRFGKRMRERDPEGKPVTYDFYEDQLVFSSATPLADETFRLKYADVRRKIRERKHVMILSTGQKNRFAVYKTVMTPEEAAGVRELLKAHCVGRK